ncbi:MAG: TrmH family RNA methyltransferase [Acidilobaceae archaeon]
MDKLRLVLVGVEGSVNLGFIARLAENFAVDELYLVGPQASIEEAERYAARASKRLRSAVVVESLAEALRGVSLSICTSAIASLEDTLRTALTVWEAAEVAAATEGTVALVMGRESTGLKREEIELCSTLATIPASPSYPELNLSNATAIFLYEFFKRRGRGHIGVKPVSPRTMSLLRSYARALARALIADENKAESIARGVAKLVVKPGVYESEAESLLAILSRACRRLVGRCEVEVGVDEVGESSTASHL